VLRLCRENDIPAFEKDFSLTDVYGAEESFVTGTYAGLTPVTDIDGRIIGDGNKGAVTSRLQSLYLELIEKETAA
jgi:branched-chain amino acid aminotransferase